MFFHRVSRFLIKKTMFLAKISNFLISKLFAPNIQASVIFKLSFAGITQASNWMIPARE